MKILIVSDTHRKNENYMKVLQKVGRVDLVIHLGDIEGSEYTIQEAAGCPVEMVAGNNDFFFQSALRKDFTNREVLCYDNAWPSLLYQYGE